MHSQNNNICVSVNYRGRYCSPLYITTFKDQKRNYRLESILNHYLYSPYKFRRVFIMQKRNSFLEKYYLQEFINYLNSNGKSKRTQVDYCDNVILFIQYCIKMNGKEFDPAGITTDDIISYQNYCQKSQNHTISTINIRLYSFKSYFYYLEEKEITAVNPCKNIRKIKVARKKESDCVDYQAFQNLRKLCYGYGNPQHICIFALLCIISCSEAAEIKISDIHLNFKDSLDNQNGYIELSSRGNKPITILLSKEAKKALIKWLQYRKQKNINSPFLFVSVRLNKYTGNGIYRIINKYINKLDGNKNYTPYSLIKFSEKEYKSNYNIPNRKINRHQFNNASS